MPVIIYKNNDYLNFIIAGLNPSIDKIEVISHNGFIYKLLRVIINGRTPYPKRCLSLYMSNKTIKSLKRVKGNVILIGEFDKRLLYLTAHFLCNTNHKYFWSWNEVSEKGLLPTRKMGYNISVYDYYAAIKYNLKYIHQVYRFAPMSIIQSRNITQEYDCYWLGKTKERLSLVKELEKYLLSQNLVCNFIYVNENGKRLSYLDNLRNILKTKCIIDINNKGTFGLSLRVMESIFFNRKLITTNIFVKQCDFYDPNNIFIYGEDNNENIKPFLNLKYNPVSYDILNKYDINKWIENYPI